MTTPSNLPQIPKPGYLGEAYGSQIHGALCRIGPSTKTKPLHGKNAPDREDACSFLQIPWFWVFGGRLGRGSHWLHPPKPNPCMGRTRPVGRRLPLPPNTLVLGIWGKAGKGVALAHPPKPNPCMGRTRPVGRRLLLPPNTLVLGIWGKAGKGVALAHPPKPNPCMGRTRPVGRRLPLPPNTLVLGIWGKAGKGVKYTPCQLAEPLRQATTAPTHCANSSRLPSANFGRRCAAIK